MKRKTTLIVCLAISLAVALFAIALDEKVREQLGSSYYILSLSMIGCVLLVLAGYVWDLSMVKSLRTLSESASTGADTTVEVHEDNDNDEIIGLARKIEGMARALQKVEANYRAIVEDQIDLICRYRTDGRLTFVNGAYARAFDSRRSDLLGREFPFFNPAGAIGSEAYTFEAELVSPDGRHAWIKWIQRAIRDPQGAVIEYQAVGHDSTERKEAEGALLRAKDAAETADRAKTEFLAIVSHELRTPINGIAGFSRMLMEQRLPDEVREQVQMIHSGSMALEKIIADILDLSKIEAGRIDIAREPFSLRTCIRDITAFFTPKARAGAIALDATVDPGVPDTITGDEARIRQVLSNLIGNAIKFTERGAVSLEVTCARGEMATSESAPLPVRLFFSVRDTGIGIPSDKISQLFIPFSQIDPSSARRRSGAGLGLAISKRLSERMGGTLSAESNLGEGSIFRFSVLVECEERTSSPAGV